MSAEKTNSVDIDDLQGQLTLEQITTYYGVALPELDDVRHEVRLRCFLNCGLATKSDDPMIAMNLAHPAKLWNCHQEGCGKAGSLISVCDLLKEGANAGGKPRGQRFLDILADIREMSIRFADEDPSQPEGKPKRPPLPTAKLPRAPRTTSPVPWLTSIHSVVPRGPYGDPRYRGNCGGYLIKDLLRFFKPNRVFDPMTGSGTCHDVCRELDIACNSGDVRSGFDATDPGCYNRLGPFDFIWLHPPYWRQIKYSDNPNCLSNAPSLDMFQVRLRSVIRNCATVLSKDGKLAILIGDYEDRGRRMPLVHLAKNVALEEGLWPACTDIIRFQHSNTASDRSYDRSLIPGLHDVCMIFERNTEPK
jgi:hypothetical protein